MTLYSKNGEYPKPLPHKIKLSNGMTRTDSSTFTSEELTDAGYVAVDNPPGVEYPNKLEWNGTNWVIREPNETEITQRWNWIRSECKRLLFETDYKVIKAIETNTAIDPLYVQYRQELRDLYNNVNNIDPWNVVWPSILTPDDEDPGDESLANTGI